MRLKQASKTQKMTANLVRQCLIRGGVLPRNFPKLENIGVFQICEPETDAGGFGGFDKDGSPFVCLNMAFIHTMQDYMVTVAHEFLHIDQGAKNINHDNKFRAKCAKVAKILGVSYYQVFAYDKPSKVIAAAKALAYYDFLRAHGVSKSFNPNMEF